MKEKPKPKTISKPKESVKVVSPKKVEEPELDFSLKRDDKLDDLVTRWGLLVVLGIYSRWI